MKEKVIWTITGRKKRFLVDDDNMVHKELEDLGPLSESQLEWVDKRPGIPYEQWLKEKDQKKDTPDLLEESGE